MKIVCEACAAKYSISDDKVRGKVFKIRCKKCSHIIVVRGDADQAPEERARGNSAPPEPQAAASAEAVWYVVVEGEQVGPLTEADVASRVSRNEISGETFAWREGMADWIQVSAIAEFAGALSAAPARGGFEDADSPFAPQPTAVYPPGTAENMFGDDDATPSPASPAINGSAKRSEATEVFGSPGALGHAPAEQDLFAPQAGNDPFAGAATSVSPSSQGGGSGMGGGGFFNVPAAAAPAAASSGGAGLTAQRSENSVLFSLSNLEALAAPSPASSPSFGSFSSGGGGFGASPAPAPAPAAEGSGLIDIRSMAAMTLGKPAGGSSSPFGSGGFGSPASAPELPTFSAAPLAPMSPMLMPTRAASGVPPYVWPLAGLVIVLLAAISWLVLKSPESPVVAPVAATGTPDPMAAAPPTATPPPTTPPPTAPVETAPPVKDEPLPPREQPTAAAPAAKRPSSGAGKKPAATASAPSKAPVEDTPVVAAAKPAAPVEAPKKGSLDDLLAGAVGGTAKKPPAPAATPAASEPAKKAGPLSKSDIVKGMMGIAPKTSACYQQYKVPGTANVNIKVGHSGKVDDATVTGKFAGTPSGDCVEKAVKTAKFPPSDGLSFPYPIPLR